MRLQEEAGLGSLHLCFCEKKEGWDIILQEKGEMGGSPPSFLPFEKARVDVLHSYFSKCSTLYPSRKSESDGAPFLLLLEGAWLEMFHFSFV